MSADRVFDEYGNPRYGYCQHGEANGFCDRGGCDEFWEHKREAEALANRAYEVKYATDKQIGFLRSLIKQTEIKTTTLASGDTSLARYLRNRQDVDQNEPYVRLASLGATVCYYSLAKFIERRDALMTRINNGERVLMSEVSWEIKTHQNFPKKSATPTVAVTTSSVEEASAKQKGFIKSLVAKKQITADIEAQVEGALADKRKASAFISTLLALPDKTAVGA